MVFWRLGRCSLTIALLVEGATDKYIFKELARRILGEKIGVEIRDLHGAGNILNENKIIARLDTFSKNKKISKIIICKDSECTPDTKTRRELEELRKKINAQRYSTPIHYVVVNHAPEAWLLGDPETIAKYLNKKVIVKASDTNDCRPKELLESFFQKAKKGLIAIRDYPKLSESVDINKICGNNQSFNSFVKILKDH